MNDHEGFRPLETYTQEHDGHVFVTIKVKDAKGEMRIAGFSDLQVSRGEMMRQIGEHIANVGLRGFMAPIIDIGASDSAQNQAKWNDGSFAVDNVGHVKCAHRAITSDGRDEHLFRVELATSPSAEGQCECPRCDPCRH